MFPRAQLEWPDPAQAVVPVGVMHVGDMRVRMPQWPMRVKMRVRLARRVGSVVRVPMMLVVHVRMGVAHGFVNMLVLMVLRHVKPYAHTHQTPGDRELRGDGFAKRDHRRGAA